ncbi:MAG TPA: hypothetical protein VGH37_15625 [Candidatus Acidoferrum sp.]
MTLSRVAIAIACLYSLAWRKRPPVTVASPCECRDNHGKGRWPVKTDSSLPSADAGSIPIARSFMGKSANI